jgi:hypothetical protein
MIVATIEIPVAMPPIYRKSLITEPSETLQAYAHTAMISGPIAIPEMASIQNLQPSARLNANTIGSDKTHPGITKIESPITVPNNELGASWCASVRIAPINASAASALASESMSRFHQFISTACR